MTQQYAPGLFDRLMEEPLHAALGTDDPAWTLQHLKDALGRDLEALFNTRTALPSDLLTPYPAVRKSILNYGLIDFAGMCLTSDEDRNKICAALRAAVERHEPRLHVISATLRVHPTTVNRVDFTLSARLKANPASEVVQFDAILRPSTQQFAIRKSSSPQNGDS